MNEPPGQADGGPERPSSGLGKLPRPGDPQEVIDRVLQLLIESVHDYAIFALDRDGYILSWNKGAQRFKGYLPHEIIGRHFSTFYPQSAIDAGLPAYELEVAAEVGRFEDEGWRIRKDGTRFWANVVITALRDGAGVLVGFAKVTRDLTERRAAELKRLEDERRLAEAEAANRAKSDFLASMSHELRTPLNAIGGYVDLILLGIHGTITEQQRDDLIRIRRSQQHLLGIINDLLNFSRLEAGRVSYQIEPFRMAEVIDAVRLMVEPQAAAKQIRLHWPSPSDDVMALGDRSKVEQILINLLTNSVKFTDDGGSIAVSHEAGADVVEIHVADTGMGISADKLEVIFEPFVQVGRNLSSGHEGTGLGLAISRDLARAMDGDLRVTSEVDAGSTFTLTLPRAPHPGERPALPASA